MPYYKIHRGAGKYDWSFADKAMNEIQRLNITPILDLLHFGVPNHVELQRRIINEARAHLINARESGDILEIPMTWAQARREGKAY